MREKHRFWTRMLCVALLAGTAQTARAQLREPRQPQRPILGEATTPPAGQTLTRRMLKASYEQLVKDIERLFELAAQLKEEVSKADEDVLSVSVIKKAEEIEKLAEKIQSRMKNL